MKKWRCTVCGEIVESDVRPDKCPLCKAPGEKFVEGGEESNTWATEHVIGVAKEPGVPAEIVEGLRANFQGECTEVGMYLAMSRAAASRQASEQGAREDVRETRTETTVLSIKTSDNKKWKMNDVEDIEERK